MYHPTNEQSNNPSYQRSFLPTILPSNDPSFQWSFLPMILPSNDPSFQRTFQCIILPTNNPTIHPSNDPSFQRSFQFSSSCLFFSFFILGFIWIELIFLFFHFLFWDLFELNWFWVSVLFYFGVIVFFFKLDLIWFILCCLFYFAHVIVYIGVALSLQWLQFEVPVSKVLARLWSLCPKTMYSSKRTWQTLSYLQGWIWDDGLRATNGGNWRAGHSLTFKATSRKTCCTESPNVWSICQYVDKRTTWLDPLLFLHILFWFGSSSLVVAWWLTLKGNQCCNKPASLNKINTSY